MALTAPPPKAQPTLIMNVRIQESAAGVIRRIKKDDVPRPVSVSGPARDGTTVLGGARRAEHVNDAECHEDALEDQRGDSGRG